MNQLSSCARNGTYIFMLPNQEEKIRNIFAGAKSFAVVLDDEAAEETFLAKEALAAAFGNAGLTVRSYPERRKNLAEKWNSLLPAESGAPAVFSTSILIPKNKIEIQEVSYTEDSRYVSININASEEISQENAVFKTLPAKVDAVFCFDKLPEGLSQKIIVPEQNNIIALSASSSSGGETMAGKVFDIIQTIESSGDVPVKNGAAPDLLLASLFIETDQLQKNINGETLALASSLINLGADKEKIAGILNDKSPSFARLLGRALARSYPNESLQSMWTFIAEQDLEKTGAEPSLALFGKIMKKLKNLLEPRPIFVLIWQTKQEVWAMISLSSRQERREDQNVGEKLENSLSAKKEDGSLISGPYKNFSEAELKIQNVLKEAL